MNNTSAVSINILGREYPLKLSVNAMQEIKKLYGGVGGAAERLQAADDIFERLQISVALVSILATEGARSRNFEHPNDEPIPDLPVDVAGTVLTIADMGEITPKLVRAMNDGMGREIFSEDDEKNTPGA